jgi:type III secretion protein L
MPVGKVIKSEGIFPDPLPERAAPRPQRPGPGVVSAEVWDAKKAADDILNEARRKAEQIIADAQAQSEQVLSEAQEAGRQQGLAEVSEQLVRAKIQAGEILAQNESDVIALACKVAEKIIGRDIERDPQALVELCATAVENVRSAKSVVLRVNPKAAAFLRERRKEVMDLIGRTVDLAIKEDPEIDKVGCIIQTEFGTIDAQLRTQLDMLEQVLLDADKTEGPA